MTIMGRIAAQLNDAATNVPAEELRSAQDTIERLGADFHQAIGATGPGHAESVLIELRQASQELSDALSQAHQVVNALAAFTNHLGLAPIRRTLPRSAPVRVPKPTLAFDPAPYLAQMPERRPAGPGQPRQKTHGRLIRSDGTAEALISGEHDRDFELARDRAWDLGLAPRSGPFIRAAHIEIKISSRMYEAWQRTKQPQHETIVINNVPCAVRKFDCEFIIEHFLPPGSTLTVCGTDGFRKTYQGKDIES